jgi:hypothetical protein
MTKLAVDLLLLALAHAQELGQLIQTARTENREVSEAELDGLQAKYAGSKSALQAEIDKQRGAS